MARKLSLERALGPTALAAVAYGEVGSSLYFALGIVALYALGLTPIVLLVVGALFLHRRRLVRGGSGRDPGDRRRSHVRQAGVQRPARLRHRLGAVPRLPDRRRARRPVHAALRRHRGRLGRPHAAALGRTGRRARDPRARGEPAGAAHADVPRRDRRRGDRARDARAPDRARRGVRARARGLRGRLGAGLGRARVRTPARDARLHGSRDRRQLRRPRRGSRARRCLAGCSRAWASSSSSRRCSP